MGGACQREWLHGVPQASTDQPRISLDVAMDQPARPARHRSDLLRRPKFQRRRPPSRFSHPPCLTLERLPVRICNDDTCVPPGRSSPDRWLDARTVYSTATENPRRDRVRVSTSRRRRARLCPTPVWVRMARRRGVVRVSETDVKDQRRDGEIGVWDSHRLAIGGSPYRKCRSLPSHFDPTTPSATTPRRSPNPSGVGVISIT